MIMTQVTMSTADMARSGMSHPRPIPGFRGLSVLMDLTIRKSPTAEKRKIRMLVPVVRNTKVVMSISSGTLIQAVQIYCLTG